jgi:hypothetical protein
MMIVRRCSVCDLRFRLKSELKQHYPVHYVNGERPNIPAGNDDVTPMLMLKPEETEKVEEKELVKENVDRTITITISRNGLDKNGLAGDITINIGPENS